jgi:hypothetical protein
VALPTFTNGYAWEIRDGFSQDHRVYWGWCGAAMLSDGRHP